MKTLLHITFAKMRKDSEKILFQSFAAFVSMFSISFFVCFAASLEAFRAANPTFGIEAVGGENILTIESFKSFFKEIVSGISFIAIAIIILSFVSLFIFTRLRIEENKHFFATLTSIGATSGQRIIISVTEALVLYGFPILLGSLLGMFPSQLFTGMVAHIFVSNYEHSPFSIQTPILLAIIGIILVLVFTYVPRIRRRKSVIETVKAHNEKESGELHNYRNSYTFRHMPIEQRIAKKSVAYYSSTYRRITFMFISCVMYPVLAIIFFVLVSEASITDYTPTYGVDAAELVGIFAKNIAIFGVLAFLALTVFGVLQTMYIIQAHNRVRRETLATYKSIGMTDVSIKKVLKYEYMTAVFHAVVYLMFILVFVLVGINSF
ncbi:MAG: FtsX-like permease family protein [Clostridia bacterium]|nr:FtsX-like permease family protein [Clostridia bacterium]